jgi:uncharacterized protein (TIGR02597 family)
MKPSLPLACAVSLSLLAPAFAQIGATSPVGMMTVEAPAHTDTAVPIPLARPAIYHGFLSGISGATLLVSDAPAWTGETLKEAHYVRFETGKAAGRYYTVKAGEAGRLVIDWNGEMPAAAAGDEFNVIPYWTLALLLPPAEEGRFFIASRSLDDLGTTVYLRDPGQPRAASSVTAYIFRAGAWRKFGGAAEEDCGGTPIAPDAVLMIRNGKVGTALVASGGVSVTPASVVINAPGGSDRQDNELSLGVPASVALARSNLVESGAFEPSPSAEVRRDELRIYSGSGHVSRLLAAYYHCNGAWRKTGAPADQSFDNTLIFVPGTRVVLSKAGTGGAPRSSYWTQPRLVGD